MCGMLYSIKFNKLIKSQIWLTKIVFLLACFVNYFWVLKIYYISYFTLSLTNLFFNFTSAGGSTLYIETAIKKPFDPAVNETGSLELTGHLGNVMKESAQLAYTYAKSFTAQIMPENSFMQKAQLHMHVPEVLHGFIWTILVFVYTSSRLISLQWHIFEQKNRKKNLYILYNNLLYSLNSVFVCFVFTIIFLRGVID